MAFPLLAVLSIASTAMGVLQGIQSSRAQEDQYKAQAKREELAGRQREIDRKKSLLRALASQNAARGAQGVAANAGSPAAMMREDLDEADRDQLVDDANTEYRVGTAKDNAAMAKSSGQFTAATSLLDFASKRVRTGKF